MRFQLVVAFWLAVSAAAHSQEAPPASAPSAADVARLIKQLDADEFDAREAATEALIKAGEPAEADLKKATADSKSAEVKQRAARVLAAIQRERLQRNALKLDGIYQLARAICDQKARPEDIDPMIDKILGEIAAATKREDLKAPVRIGNCVLRPGRTFEKNTLVIGDEANNTGQLQDSVAILDLGGQVSSVQNSIVVAWGVVDISSCNNAIIIAGADVSVSHAVNSVILAGGRVDLSHGQKVVIGAGELLRANFLRENSVVVNTKYEARVAMPGEMVSTVEVPGLILRDKPLMERVLDDKLEVTYLSNAFMLFRMPSQPGEYVVRTGNEFLDPLGKPLPGLEGWKIGRASYRFATLKKGEERTFLRMSRPGE